MPEFPDWVEDHNDTGIEIKQRGDNYYAYKVTSEWDSEKGHPRKITEKYLGKVTPDGIRPPKHERNRTPESILETGNILLVRELFAPIQEPLAEAFPETWQTLLAAATLKLCYGSPLKRLAHHHESSWSSRLWPEATLSKNSLTTRVREWGGAYDRRVEVFRSLADDGDHIAIDLTQVYSESENITWLEKGYNAHQEFRNQLQLLLVYNLTAHVPVFLKLLPGSLRDVSTLENALAEANFGDAIVVVDKGFWSSQNFEELQASQLGYLAAVPRNSSLLTYVSASDYPTYFEWKDNHVWARSYATDDDRTVHHFLDMTARAEEEDTMLGQVDEGKKDLEKFHNHRERMGTLALVTNRDFTAESAYQLYKQRIEIESAFDVLVNTLEADKSFMQDREAIQGYMFMLFLALYAHSALLDQLRETELLDRYSVPDVLEQLSKMYRVVIDGDVIDSEVTKQTRELIDDLEIPITQSLGS
ncbi:MAG: transposase [Halobacteriaceae archaeon]